MMASEESTSSHSPSLTIRRITEDERMENVAAEAKKQRQKERSALLSQPRQPAPPVPALVTAGVPYMNVSWLQPIIESVRQRAMDSMREATPGGDSGLLDTISDSVNQLGDLFYACPGLTLNVPDPVRENYPFGIHSLHPSLPWVLDFETDTVRAVGTSPCSRLILCTSESRNKGPCDGCAELATNEYIINLQDRAWQSDLHSSRVKTSLLTEAQTRMKRAEVRETRMSHHYAILGRDRKLATLMKPLDEHKRVLVLLAENKTPRVHAIMARMQREGCGIHAVVAVLEKAAAGLYHAKVFDEEDYDLAILDLRLGGPRLVYARAHSSEGGPCANQIKTLAKLPPYVSLYVSGSYEKDLAIVRQNFDRHLFSRPWPTDQPRTLHHLLMDDIKGSKRARISDHDGCLRGVCWHMLGKLDPLISSFADAKQLRGLLDTGEVHYAT